MQVLSERLPDVPSRLGAPEALGRGALGRGPDAGGAMGSDSGPVWAGQVERRRTRAATPSGLYVVWALDNELL